MSSLEERIRELEEENQRLRTKLEEYQKQRLHLNVNMKKKKIHGYAELLIEMYQLVDIIPLYARQLCM